jgi:hypothetical protein
MYLLLLYATKLGDTEGTKYSIVAMESPFNVL